MAKNVGQIEGIGGQLMDYVSPLGTILMNIV